MVFIDAFLHVNYVSIGEKTVQVFDPKFFIGRLTKHKSLIKCDFWRLLDLCMMPNKIQLTFNDTNRIQDVLTPYQESVLIRAEHGGFAVI